MHKAWSVAIRNLADVVSDDADDIRKLLAAARAKPWFFGPLTTQPKRRTLFGE